MSNDFGTENARASAAAIQKKLSKFTPDIGLILGSGLGGLADQIKKPVKVRYNEIPGFPIPTAEGHAGLLIAGELAGKKVVALSGRFHLYEGHPIALAGFPVRVLHALGARILVVSNAAGGINIDFRAGDIMIMKDHLNLMWRNPLIGPQQAGEERFPDMSEPYDAMFRKQLRSAGEKLGMTLREGVYAGLFGPSYETRAELKMLRTLGADAVGMSTVPEVIVARALGMRVAGLSCITNAATGAEGAPLSHAEVLEVAEKSSGMFQSLVREFVGSVALTK